MEQFSGTNSNDSGPALDEMIGEFEKENNFWLKIETLLRNEDNAQCAFIHC
jgi:hypothetical protein